MTRNCRNMIEKTADSLLLSKDSIQFLALFLLLSVTIGQKPYFSKNKKKILCISQTFIINVKKKDYRASECQNCIHSPIEMDVFDWALNI